MRNTRQELLTTTEARYSGDENGHPGIGEFRQMVQAFYQEHKRPMAWRETTDPYRILLSEIMLQQTQVERVALKYPEFIARFPDFPALARASPADILPVWQGMGYNRRAIALQKCAERVMTEFGGTLPCDVDTLATFPGIGRATASSIAAFAFNLPVVFIETNIRRVFIHFFFSDGDTVSDNEILPLVGRSLDRENPREWYWALMDLGTSLKKSVPNPNRRSVHYTKQSAFVGSDRKIRGGILRMLVSGKKMTVVQVAHTCAEDTERVAKILGALESEGFIRKDGKYFGIVS
ncbi:A/G-specific adenine glycosylase [Methanoregula sp.]|uniref:A/G-specific adenine glycosylase n=1 Tax=Methanoregula sp. TaxID=2052170 RepID=UPI003C714B56